MACLTKRTSVRNIYFGKSFCLSFFCSKKLSMTSLGSGPLIELVIEKALCEKIAGLAEQCFK